MAFLNTNNKDPYVGPCTPGPDLWSASIFALNVTTGAFIWGFQANAHDLWDYDCSWWQAAANETVNGVNTPVIFKTCKNGYLFELNARTGDLIWAWTPTQSILPRCFLCYMWNPLNRTQMILDFPTSTKANPENPNPPMLVGNPGTSFEDEQAYSPTLNYVFGASENLPIGFVYTGENATTYFTTAGDTFGPPAPGEATIGSQDNATIFAINMATGQAVWNYFVPTQGYRGGVTTSGNTVFLTLSSGSLVMLNAQTGQLIRNFYVGGPLNVLPSIGATSSGQEEVVVSIEAGLVTWGTSVPGDLVGLTLQSLPPSSAATTTVTATGAPGSTTTTTTTTTVVSTSVSSGTSTTTYGVAAVAVIFIIATGYLAMRGRKPAS